MKLVSKSPTALDSGVDGHLRRIAEEGYTVLPNAIAPDLVAEIDEALVMLERDLGTVPADNLFEGLHTRPRLQPPRPRRDVREDPGPPECPPDR